MPLCQTCHDLEAPQHDAIRVEVPTSSLHQSAQEGCQACGMLFQLTQKWSPDLNRSVVSFWLQQPHSSSPRFQISIRTAVWSDVVELELFHEDGMYFEYDISTEYNLSKGLKFHGQ